MRIRPFMSVTLLVAAVAMTGCGSGSSADSGGAKSGDPLTIGVSYMTLNNIYYDPMNAAAKKKAAELGVEYVSVDSRLDVSRQITGIENLIARHVDGILVNPVDSDAVEPAILEANDAGIPVMTLDVGAHGGEVVSHIASDNYKAGRVAGDFVAKQLDRGSQVAIVDGTPITTFQQRAKGFTDAVKAAGLDIVAHPHANENTPEAFTTVTENLITAHPEVKYLFTVNDYGAAAANTAIKDSGRKDVFVVSVDGDPTVTKLIKQGSAVKATVGQQPAKIGSMGIEAMVKSLKGDQIAKNITSPVTLVTKRNAGSFSW